MLNYLAIMLVFLRLSCHRCLTLEFSASKVSGVKSNGTLSGVVLDPRQWISCLKFCASHLSMNCSVVNLNTESGQCNIVNDSKYSLSPDPRWNLYYIGALHPWEMVFLVSSGAGFPVYDTWTGVSVGGTDPSVCSTASTTPCGNHFRSPLIDVWNTLSIQKVKVELYESGVKKVYLIFEGRGKDLISWFSQGTLIESSWKQLKSATESITFETFHLIGDRTHGRSFTIIRNYGGCPVDYLWMTVIDTHGRGACDYDKLSVPAILYATRDEGQRFEVDGYGQADTLAVYINRT